MQASRVAMIALALSLGAATAWATTPQHQGHATTTGTSQSSMQNTSAMSHDRMMMAQEPHHILAMAYRQSLDAFATALQAQSVRARSVNVEFARAAVTEMRRSFDQLQQHHQAHVLTMNAKMQGTMSGMMQKMDSHRTEINTQLTALEHEVESATPDAKRVASLAGRIHTHLVAMSNMMKHMNTGTSKMNMKM